MTPPTAAATPRRYREVTLCLPAEVYQSLGELREAAEAEMLVPWERERGRAGSPTTSFLLCLLQLGAEALQRVLEERRREGALVVIPGGGGNDDAKAKAETFRSLVAPRR